MKKALLVVFALFATTVGLAILITSKFVEKSGDIIWVSDPKAKGEWVKNDNVGEWWAKISNENTQNVIVYLSPFTEYSATRLQKDDIPLAYANWGRWGFWQVLRISIVWDEWGKIDESKNNHLVSFISKQLVRKWEVDEEVALKFTSSVINMDKSPVEIQPK